MLSDDNIERINDQIRGELRIVDSMMSSAETKTQALDRIAKLKAILDDPSESSTDGSTETYDLADLGRDIRDLIRAIRRS